MYLTEYRQQKLNNNLLLSKITIWLFITFVILSGFFN